MLTPFDWLRLSRSGTELLATLFCLTQEAERFAEISEAVMGIGPPITALTSPCGRCWVYPRVSEGKYCRFCQMIRQRGERLGQLSRHTLIVWGFVNWLPRQLRPDVDAQEQSQILGVYTPDANHFLVMLRRQQLQFWLQELVLYHGGDLKGHLQIFPTMGIHNGLTMGDVLVRAINHDAYFPLDQLRVRLYSKPQGVLRPHELDRQGILTFDIAEILNLLDMAEVFRSVIHPNEREILYQLLTIDEQAEAPFYWGRLLGILNREARDMLDAWQIRRWPLHRVKFFYELTSYVGYKTTY